MPERSRTHQTYEAKWDLGPANESIQTILRQRFFYLAKGTQFFVFESEDGKYVVKVPFFNHCKLTQGVPILTKIKQGFGVPKRPSKVFDQTKVDEIIHLTFDSCKLCFDLLQNETGLIWCHLNPAPTPFRPFQVQDKRGIWKTIDPAKHPFIIQKKAMPLLDAFKTSSRDMLFASYLDLLASIDAKQCFNLDRKGRENFGVIEGKVVQIDCGTFVKSDQKQKEFFATKMQHWLNKQ